MRNSPTWLVLRDLRANPVLAAGGVAAALIATGATLLQPALIAEVINAVTRRAPVLRPVAALAIVMAAGIAGTLAADYLDARRETAAVVRHRVRLVAHVLRMSPADDRFAPGDLVSRLVTDAKAPALLATLGLYTFTTSVTSVGALAGLALIDPWLCLVVLAETLAVGAVVRAFLRRGGQAQRRYQAARGELAMRLLDAHQGIRTIRACGTRDREVRRIITPLAEMRSAGLAIWRSQRDVNWKNGAVAALMRVAMLLVAGLGVLQGQLTAGEMVAALAYGALALGLANSVDMLTVLAQQRAATRRVTEILDSPVLGSADPPATLPAHGRGAIRFADVTLRQGDRTVLDAVSFTVPAGTQVAVVGASGTGKSLLVALAARLAEPTSGRIELDGVDVRALDLAALRQAVAYAFESPRLFGPSLRAAIAAGSARAAAPGQPDDVAEAAAGLARADGFIRRLPHGYDTPVGEALMSGGELQRVGLARALARPARLLVLDDATSSLDTATEAEVGLAIATAWSGRTALVVAHRARTAAAAQLVAWLDGSRLRALRPHAELWNDPEYRAVFQPDPAEPAPGRHGRAGPDAVEAETVTAKRGSA